MNNEDLKKYLKNPQFQRNEIAWVFSTVDHFTNEEIAKRMGLTVDVVTEAVRLHQQYWETTE